MKKRKIISILAGIFLVIALALLGSWVFRRKESGQSGLFVYSFNVPGTLEEAGSLEESPSPYFWLDSGGYMNIQDGVGETARGRLPGSDKWRSMYALSNPADTGEGYTPQNIFRLLTKSTWLDFSEQAYFRIASDNLSESPNRNESNGLLLMGRYIDSDNLYYAGVRVDGHAVIKKKSKGKYATLAEVPIIKGTYDREKNPNLLPKDKWVGLRMEIKRGDIKLYADLDGEWKLAAQASDSEIPDKGHAGIRTDFMDVEFKDYRIEEIR